MGRPNLNSMTKLLGSVYHPKTAHNKYTYVYKTAEGYVYLTDKFGNAQYFSTGLDARWAGGAMPEWAIIRIQSNT